MTNHVTHVTCHVGHTKQPTRALIRNPHDNQQPIKSTCPGVSQIPPSKNDAINFLKESRRVLKNNGIIRTVIPDIKYLVENYITSNDADTFIENTLLSEEHPTLTSKIKYLFLGNRNHQWMYDGNSLSKLLTNNFTMPNYICNYTLRRIYNCMCF